MEMQEQITQNDIVYDEAHDVKNDNEGFKSEGRIQIMLRKVYQF